MLSSLITENKFQSILLDPLKHNPLIDRGLLGVIYLFNYFEDVNNGLYMACEVGSPVFAKLMMERGANDWNEGFLFACYHGQKELALLMI